MLHRYKFFIIILAGVISIPFSSIAVTVEPGTDCPNKKKILEEDSVNIYESENKVFEDVQTQNAPEKRLEAETRAEKTTYRTSDNSLDESDEVAESDPNSAMSFNFIYYIIDKFKFTDPLE